MNYVSYSDLVLDSSFKFTTKAQIPEEVVNLMNNSG